MLALLRGKRNVNILQMAHMIDMDCCNEMFHLNTLIYSSLCCRKRKSHRRRRKLSRGMTFVTLIDSMSITSVTYILSDRIRYDNQRLCICVFFLRSPAKIRKIEKRGERVRGGSDQAVGRADDQRWLYVQAHHEPQADLQADARVDSSHWD